MANITVRPGSPFWLAFTAFASNMILLVGIDQLDVTALALQVNWGAAVTVSIIVAAAVYGKAKVDEVGGSSDTAAVE